MKKPPYNIPVLEHLPVGTPFTPKEPVWIKAPPGRGTFLHPDTNAALVALIEAFPDATPDELDEMLARPN